MSDEKKAAAKGLLLQRRLANTRGFGFPAECQERVIDPADGDPANVEGDLLSSVPAPDDATLHGWREVKG